MYHFFELKQSESYEINGKSYPVSGHIIETDKKGNITGFSVPLVDLPWISDYRWQYNALKSRLEHPERYLYDLDGNEVNNDGVCAELVEWLLANPDKAKECDQDIVNEINCKYATVCAV